MKYIVTVFGSSIPKPGDKDYEEAYQLGKLLADNGFNVCTGGYQGIMDAVSKGATERGAEAIGITVDLWGSTPSKYLTKEIKCETLFERISKLVDYADGFIILKGGTGTLLELATVWEMINRNLLRKKPVACHSKMWKEIVSLMDRQIESEKRQTGIIKYFDSYLEITDYLKEKIG